MSGIIWYLSFSDWLILLSIMLFRSIHAVAKGKISFFSFLFFFKWPNSMYHCVNVAQFFYPLIYWGTLGLLPNLGYCKCCCNEYRGAYILFLFFYSSLEDICFFFFKITPAKSFLKKRFYLFIFREKGREGEREGNSSVWLPLALPWQGTRPTTQACALTGNRTVNPLIRRPLLNPLSHTS